LTTANTAPHVTGFYEIPDSIRLRIGGTNLNSIGFTLVIGVKRVDKKERGDLELLFALINGARRSDRELAKALKVSQPTVGRKRERLEREGYVAEYTVIPDLTKIGYDFIAVTFLSFSEDRPGLFDKAREWVRKRPCIIYATDGEGMGMNSLMMSVHMNYASYSKLITELRREWQPNLKDIQTFMISLARPELLIKPLSFRYLEDSL
jgi:DNA-binding Lrp family transcriptional regulator